MAETFGARMRTTPRARERAGPFARDAIKTRGKRRLRIEVFFFNGFAVCLADSFVVVVVIFHFVTRGFADVVSATQLPAANDAAAPRRHFGARHLMSIVFADADDFRRHRARRTGLLHDFHALLRRLFPRTGALDRRNDLDGDVVVAREGAIMLASLERLVADEIARRTVTEMAAMGLAA